jgi:hypothetical protein
MADIVRISFKADQVDATARRGKGRKAKPHAPHAEPEKSGIPPWWRPGNLLWEGGALILEDEIADADVPWLVDRLIERRDADAPGPDRVIVTANSKVDVRTLVTLNRALARHALTLPIDIDLSDDDGE